MFKKIMLVFSVVVIVGLVMFFAIDGSAKKNGELKTVAVEKGSIIDKALAVGRRKKVRDDQDGGLHAYRGGVVGLILRHRIFSARGDGVLRPARKSSIHTPIPGAKYSFFTR